MARKCRVVLTRPPQKLEKHSKSRILTDCSTFNTQTMSMWVDNVKMFLINPRKQDQMKRNILSQTACRNKASFSYSTPNQISECIDNQNISEMSQSPKKKMKRRDQTSSITALIRSIEMARLAGIQPPYSGSGKSV